MVVGWQAFVMLAAGAVTPHPLTAAGPGAGGWTHSLGAAALELLEGQAGVRAAFRFSDADADEPHFITRRLAAPLRRRGIVGVSFRYRLTLTDPAGDATVPLDPVHGFRVRLRTSPTSFDDLNVPRPAGGWPVDRWVEVHLDAGIGPNVRNVYRTLFDQPDVIEVTFRLGEQPGARAAGFIELAGAVLEMEEAGADEPYLPQPAIRTVNDTLDVFVVRHSMDGYLDAPEAAAFLPGAQVTEALFRGLHFPIFEFPATRDALLRYDVIVLDDVDPYVLTTAQLHWLADAVHAGVGLLVMLGPNSGGDAQGKPPALLDLLPVTIEPAAATVKADTSPVTDARHPVADALPAAALGLVRRLVPVRARDDGQVLLACQDHALLVAGQAGAGRVLVWTSWAQPSRLGDGSFMTTTAWRRYLANCLSWLAGGHVTGASLRSELPPAVEVAWQYGHRCLAPGYPFGLQLTAQARRRCELQLRTAAGELWSWAGEAGPEPVVAAGTCPPADLPDGPQTVEVWVDGARRPALDGLLTPPLDRDEFYPIISYQPVLEAGHGLDPDGIDAMVGELFDHGFNTIALSGFGNHATASLTSELRGLAEMAAAKRGMATILEYTSITGLPHDRAYEHSPFSPEFEPWLAGRLAAGFEQSRSMPRLLSAKLRDEPTLRPEQLPADDATREAARRLSGLVALDPRQADGPAGRWAYGKLASAAVEQDFATAQKLKRRAGLPYDLCVTYYSAGFGGTAPSKGMQDAWHWTQPADRFDFDVYPYFYPSSDRIRFVEADWGFAASRAMSRAQQKPWGFYIELDDRNWPFQQNPAEASAECAYSAVAAGADYLNSFIHRGFGTGHMSRPERWAKTGAALREIRELGPELTRLPRQPARVAVLWPETANWSGDGYLRPWYTRALLAQALGDCDVVHESELVSGLPATLDLLVLVGVSSLADDAAAGLRAWIRAGNTVWCDGLPEHDQRGQRLRWDSDPAGGRVIVEEAGLESRLREAVEGDDATAWPARLRELQTRLEPRLRPHREVFSVRVASDARVESAGLRQAGGAALLVVVNHAPEARAVTVELRDGPFVPRSARLLDQGDVPLLAVDGGVTLTVQVPARWGRFVRLE